MNKSSGFISQKSVKFFRLFKYVILSIVFVAFAFFRWIFGGHPDELDNENLSHNFKKILPHFFVPEVNADVPTGDGGGDGGGDDGGGGDGGC